MMKTKKKLSKLSANRIKKQLGLSAAAIAGCAFGAGDMASAAIINTFQGANLAVPATLAGVYINLASGATGASAGAVAGWDFNPYQTTSGLGFYWNITDPVGADSGAGVVTVPAGTVYADLAFGTVVGVASPFSSAIQGSNPTYRTTGTHYLGFRFNNSGTLNYGYAAIQSTAGSGNGAGFPATLLGWRYEDTGAAITVSAIPEPGSIGLLAGLAAGASALRALRRRSA